jgi:hypothetical protein
VHRNTASVAEEGRPIDREWHLREEGQQHIPKGLAIGLNVAVIPWKVDLDLRNGRCDETQQEYNMPYRMSLERQKMADSGVLNPRNPAFCS